MNKDLSFTGEELTWLVHMCKRAKRLSAMQVIDSKNSDIKMMEALMIKLRLLEPEEDEVD